MRVMLVAALIACGSEKAEKLPPPSPELVTLGEPFDAQVVDAHVVDTFATTIALPVLAGKPAVRPEVLAVAQVIGGWRVVDAQTIAIEKNVAAIPPGPAITIAEIAHRAGPAGVLVLAPATTRWEEVSELAFALHRDCWAFAAASGNTLTATWPATCPQPATPMPNHERPELAALIEPARTTIGAAPPYPATFNTGDHGTVAKRLEQLRVERPAFAKSTSLAYAVENAATVAAVVEVVAAMHAAGFVDAHWVPGPWLPMQFPSGPGVDPAIPPPPPPPPPPPVIVTIDNAVVRGALTGDEVDRVVRTRVGLYRACYQKELARDPKLAGKLRAKFEIDGGLPGNLTLSGFAKKDAFVECVRSMLVRLKYPLKQPKTRVELTLTFKSG